MASRSRTPGALPSRSARQKQLVLLISRVWAWVFLAGLIILFAASVSIQSGGDVNFLTIRNSQNILMAIDTIESDYEQHSRAAREIAEEYFAAENVLRGLIERVGL